MESHLLVPTTLIVASPLLLFVKPWLVVFPGLFVVPWLAVVITIFIFDISKAFLTLFSALVCSTQTASKEKFNKDFF